VVSQSGVPPDDGCSLASAMTTLVGAPEFSIQRFLMGARMNFADTAAAIDTTAAEMNTVLHPPFTDSTDASGTSIDAVPFAV
jgi:hypothetical protein